MPERSGDYLTINKNTITVTAPKAGVKAKTIAIKIATPEKKADQPVVKWEIIDSPDGITVNDNGVISVSSDAKPGCYEVAAVPQGEGTPYNTAFCEVVVK